jgi:uncharacterized protein YndB with AHSA1/START domain
MSVEPIKPFLEPIRKSVDVPLPPEAAFTVFTQDISRWWPVGKKYAVFGDESSECGIQPFVGGDIFELSTRGERCVWGRVLAWDPGRLLRFSWFPGRSHDTAQTVEISFSPVSAGTRIDLEHRDWQTLGDRAADVRSGYGAGWDEVLRLLVSFAAEQVRDAPPSAAGAMICARQVSPLAKRSGGTRGNTAKSKL